MRQLTYGQLGGSEGGRREASCPEVRRLRPGPGQDAALVAADQRARLLRAMAVLVHDVGYPKVTVDGLLAMAHVSRPTFYRLFSGKDDCFYAAFDGAAEDALRATGTATAGCVDRTDLVERGVRGICAAIAAEPSRAGLVLSGPVSLGRRGRAHKRRLELRFAELLRRRFAELDDPVELPPTLARAIVSGVGWVAHLNLSREEAAGGKFDVDELTRWVAVLTDVAAFKELARGLAPATQPSGADRRQALPALGTDDERALLVNAAIRLFSERGYEGLGADDIAAAAGVSRKCFRHHFETVADCLAAAVELGAAAAVAAGRAAARSAPTGASGVARFLDAFTRYLAANPGIARLLFVEVIAPGRHLVDRGTEFLSTVAGMLRERFAEPNRPTRQGAEAAVGAIWSSIRQEVIDGKARSLPDHAPVLTWLALAASTDEVRLAAAWPGEGADPTRQGQDRFDR